ncbi:PD-(D/E)XK nuclease family protein [Raphidiopsis sp. BLCC-F218]
MNQAEISDLIKQQLKQLIVEDPVIKNLILGSMSQYYIGRQDADSKFDRTLAQLQSYQKEQNRKWEEQNRHNREIMAQLQSYQEEQNRKWEEQNRHNLQVLEEIKQMNRKHESTVGSLGSRWGLSSEASFRNGLKGILKDSFGVEVLNFLDFDNEGEVFGRPDQVEIDVIIKNGLIILCEIKSSIDKAGMYIFDRKVAFYEKHHQRRVDRKLVISPMVDPRALPVAQNLGVEIYSYAEDVNSI